MQNSVIFTTLRGECLLITILKEIILYLITSMMKGMFAGLVEIGAVFWVLHLIL